MARTATPKRGKPAAKPPVQQWQAILLRLPSDLVAEIDAIAAADRRPRTRMIEVMLAEAVQSYRSQAAGEPLAKHLAPPTARERTVRRGTAA